MNYTVIIQVTISCVYMYHLNKQLHALSSALYQKFATFTVLLSFCFFSVKSDFSRVMRARPSLLFCSLLLRKYHRKCIVSSDWSIHDDRMFSKQNDNKTVNVANF